MADGMLSYSSRNYLDAVGRLSDTTGLVRPVDIAGELHVSKPSVTRAIKVLSREGLVYRAPDGEVSLTAAGAAAAGSLRDTCRVIQCFFAEITRSAYIPPDGEVVRLACLLSGEATAAIRASLRGKNPPVTCSYDKKQAGTAF